MKTSRIILISLIISLIGLIPVVLAGMTNMITIIFVMMMLQMLSGALILIKNVSKGTLEFGSIFLMTFFIQLFTHIIGIIIVVIKTFITLSAAGAPDTASLSFGLNLMGGFTVSFFIMVTLVPLIFSALTFGIYKFTVSKK